MPRSKSLDLRHYSDTTVRLDRQRDYTHGHVAGYRKPRGFWVSVQGEQDWFSWCRDEEFRLHRLTVEHVVDLSVGAKILYLESVDELDSFTLEYGVVEHKTWGDDIQIDWVRVAGEYDGIIIAPYQWDRRLEHDWYYPWDCASGCIWNLDAIAAVTPIWVDTTHPLPL